MRILLAAATALPLLLTSISFAVLPATPTLAMATNPSCTVITYYNNAAHSKIVGTRTMCTGQATQVTGHTSPYHKTEKFSTTSGGTGHPHGTTTQMPCEFNASGCSNIPKSRY